MKNLVIFIGNVGADPEIKHLETSSVANFNLATTERGFTTKSGQEVPERTEWHRIVVWGGLAKVVEGYVKKGTKLYVEGKLRHRDYMDSNNVRKFITEIHADNIILLGGGASSQPSPHHSPGPTNQANPVYQPGPSVQTPADHGSTGNGDDLPF